MVIILRHPPIQEMVIMFHNARFLPNERMQVVQHHAGQIGWRYLKANWRRGAGR